MQCTVLNYENTRKGDASNITSCPRYAKVVSESVNWLYQASFDNVKDCPTLFLALHNL